MYRLIFICLIIASCKPQEKTVNDMNKLVNNWVLEKIDDIASEDTLVNAPTMTVLIEEKRITGKGGCNRYFGVIEIVNETQLKFGMVGSTKMACPDMDLEMKYFKFLEQVRYYNLKSLNLQLLNSEKKVILEFKKVE